MYHLIWVARAKKNHSMNQWRSTLKIVMTTWPQFRFDKIFQVFVFEMKELSEISVKSTNFIDKTAKTHEMTNDLLNFFFFQVSKSKSNSRTRALTPNLRIQMNWFSSVDHCQILLPLLLLQVIYIYFLWSDHFYSIRQVLHTTTNPSLMMKFIIETLIDSIIVFFCQIKLNTNLHKSIVLHNFEFTHYNYCYTECCLMMSLLHWLLIHKMMNS